MPASRNRLRCLVQLDHSNLPRFARGCAVLGAGGGGDTYVGAARRAAGRRGLRPGAGVDLDELPDDALVMPCGRHRRAHRVDREDRRRTTRASSLLEQLERFTGAPVAALMAAEIGGSNGMLPVAWARACRAPRRRCRRHGPRLPRGPAGDDGAGRHLAEPGRDDRRARQRGRLRAIPATGPSGWSAPRGRVRRQRVLGRVPDDARRRPAGATVAASSRWRSGSARRSRRAERDPVEALVAELGAVA